MPGRRLGIGGEMHVVAAPIRNLVVPQKLALN
jgi:hypothetical protein